jgi:hypothetical protein
MGQVLLAALETIKAKSFVRIPFKRTGERATGLFRGLRSTQPSAAPYGLAANDGDLIEPDHNDEHQCTWR